VTTLSKRLSCAGEPSPQTFGSIGPAVTNPAQDAPVSSKDQVDSDVELTILMPCLNEAETLAICIRKAHAFLARTRIRGEVLVADNGSSDGSQQIALSEGARVVSVIDKGYGSALRGGVEAARGRYVIMGDADDSYDFGSLDAFITKLREGYQLVMGNRFAGGIDAGAMPKLHKYLGNPVLSWIGRIFFRAQVRDFHCGLRGFDRESMLALSLRTTGMEFASEVIVRACLANFRITEVPTRLHRDGRSRPPHLRSWHDGWRHLRFLLLYSPRWLFFIPGLALFTVGIVAVAALVFSPIRIGSVTFDAATTVYASAFAMVGYQSVLFAVLSKLYALHEGLLPSGQRFRSFAARLTVERGLCAGLALVFTGVVFAGMQLVRWKGAGFGELNASDTIRLAVPAALAIVLGIETVLSSMFVGVLTIKTARTDALSVWDAAAVSGAITMDSARSPMPKAMADDS
jgi:Glycosyl transferase family 2